jgi:hypothetical protein
MVCLVTLSFKIQNGDCICEVVLESEICKQVAIDIIKREQIVVKAQGTFSHKVHFQIWLLLQVEMFLTFLFKSLPHMCVLVLLEVIMFGHCNLCYVFTFVFGL